MSGELSQFEQLSAVTPKQTPYSILGGTLLAVIIIVLINTFAQNEAVTTMKDKAKASATTVDDSPAVENAGSADNLDDL